MSAEGQGILGIEGRLRCVQHDVRELKGSGPGGAVDFDDLWTIDEKGALQSRHPERIVEDRTTKNKFTKRGLGFLLATALKAHSGSYASKQPTDITYGQDRNPFQAFVLFGDDALVTPTRKGDARVLWDESDGQYDDQIASGSGVAQIGRRGITLATTSGIFKRVQIRYPYSSPDYEECEYTFFAQANGSPVETGDNGLDNFIAKGIGLAYGVSCGWNEGSSQVGTRAVLGLAPTHQGVRDREYIHEFFDYGDGSAEGAGSVVSPLHVGIADGTPRYTVGETIDGHGYVQSSNLAMSVVGSITGSGSDAFVAATKRIKLVNAPTDIAPGFTSAHVRKVLLIAGSVSNDQEFTIKRVVAADEVEVFETVVDESGATAAGTIRQYYRGLEAFDGRVDNESWFGKNTYDDDPDGTAIFGEKWSSLDTPGPHYIGRIWPTSKTIKGIRIVFPQGSLRDFCPNRFAIQYLASGDPEGGTWTTITGQDYTGSDQASNIFDAGANGYEYNFSAPVTTQGIRISGLLPTDTSRKVEIAEMFVYEEPADFSIAAPNSDIRYSLDGGVTYRTVTLPDVSATKLVSTLVSAINRRLYGWGVEAYRSPFGYLLFRSTVAGSQQQLHLDSVGNGSTVNTSLGLPSAGRSCSGVTQPFMKLAANAVTFIYTLRMAGNFSKPYDF